MHALRDLSEFVARIDLGIQCMHEGRDPAWLVLAEERAHERELARNKRAALLHGRKAHVVLEALKHVLVVTLCVNREEVRCGAQVRREEASKTNRKSG